MRGAYSHNGYIDMFTVQLKHLSQSERVRKISIWGVSIGLLFFGFLFNLWHVAEQDWFDTHQRDIESLIVGRMVKSRQDGIFSAGGLTGAGITTTIQQKWISPSQLNRHQHLAYFNGLFFDEYWPYELQPGGQGIIFSLLDRLIPLSPQIKLWSFYALTALLSSIALTAIIGWCYEEFGGWVAIFAIGSAVLSQWLTVFGRNLWWSLWAFYLPMIVVMYFLKRHREPVNRQFIRFGILIFVSVFIKCFINGSEYITTTLVMMVTPCIYYAILDRWSRHQCLKWTLATICGSGVAIFLSLTLLLFQIDALKDSPGVGHDYQSLEDWGDDLLEGHDKTIMVRSLVFGKRMHREGQSFLEVFPEVYAASLEAGTIGVVTTYVNGVFFNFNNYFSQGNTFVTNFLFKIRYYYLIVFFIVMSILLFIRSTAEQRQQNIALIWTTWFSILAPLSWYIIFKAHSYIHTHMNFLLWQMPFTFFGFAVFGAAVIAVAKSKRLNQSKVQLR